DYGVAVDLALDAGGPTLHVRHPEVGIDDVDGVAYGGGHREGGRVLEGGRSETVGLAEEERQRVRRRTADEGANGKTARRADESAGIVSERAECGVAFAIVGERVACAQHCMALRPCQADGRREVVPLRVVRVLPDG